MVRCDKCQHSYFDEWVTEEYDEQVVCTCRHPGLDYELSEGDNWIWYYWLGHRDNDGARHPPWCPRRNEDGD